MWSAQDLSALRQRQREDDLKEGYVEKIIFCSSSDFVTLKSIADSNFRMLVGMMHVAWPWT